MTGRISNVTEKYVVIETEDGREDQTDLDGWVKAHGEPKIGDPILRIRDKIANNFGTHYWGFIPANFPIPSSYELDHARKPDLVEMPS